MPPAADSIRRYPSAVRAWWAILIFAIAALLSYTDRQILAFLVDPIRADLGISDTELSILQGAAFAVLYSFIALPLGRIADLVPRRPLLVFAVVTWSAGTIACGLAHAFSVLFAARLLVGIGEAALAPAAMSLIADYFPPESRALPTGVFLTGMVIGGGTAIAIGGFLLSAAQHAVFASVPFIGGNAPWRIVLYVLGLSGVLIALLFLTLYEPARPRASFADIQKRLFALTDIVRAFRGSSAVLAPLYAAMAVGSIVDYAILSWVPALFERRFGLTPAQTGAELGVAAVAAGLIGTPLGGMIADIVARRFGPEARVQLCATVILAGFAVTPVGFIATSNVAVVCVFVWLLVSAASGTIGIAAVLDSLPLESRGLGTSTISFTNTIVGLGLGPTLVALATDHLFGPAEGVGPALSTVVAPSVALCCFLFYMATRAARRAAIA